MNITLYNSKSEKNRLHKDTYLTKVMEISGKLRESCSILNPVLTIETNSYEQLLKCNYAYIPEFNRYYFINDIVSVRNNLWQISMRVDVLMSFQDSITNLSALISRNEFESNPLIRDEKVFLQYDKQVNEYIPNTKYKNVSFAKEDGKYISLDHQVVSGSSALSVGIINLPLDNPNERITKIKLSIAVSSISMLTYAFFTNSGNEYISGSPIAPGTYTGLIVDVPKNATMFKFTYRNTNPNTAVGTSNIIEFDPASTEERLNNIVMTTIEYNSETQHDAVWYWNPVVSKPDNNVMQTVQPRSTEVVGYSQPWGMPYQTFQAISLEVAKNDTYASYIVNSVVYPFEVPMYRDPVTGKLNSHDVILGSTKISDFLSYYQLAMKQSPVIKNAEFVIESDFKNYLAYDPYTKYELYIPYCQWITLSPDQVLGHTLQLNYLITYTDGSAFAYLVDTTANRLIWGGSCQLGINVPVSTSNSLEIQKAKDANSLNMIMGLVASGVTATLGIASANPVAIAGGVLGGARTVTDYISKESQMFEKGQCNVGAGNFGLFAPQKVRVRTTSVIPLYYNDEEYAHLYGRPLNEYREIGMMSGFTLIGECHVEIPTATDSELTAIEDLLKSGILI